MKLISKTILYFLTVSIPVLMLAALISYFTIKRTVNENLNEVIWNKKRKAEAQIDLFKRPQNFCLSFDSMATIAIDTTNGKGYKYSYLFKTDSDGENVLYWELKSYYKSRGTNYLIKITEPKFETDDLIENLLEMFLITFVFLVLGFFMINWIVSKTLFKPFYKTLKQVEEYDISSNTLDLGKTSTKEFKQLNEVILKMTNKVHADFAAQKEFTENASHEIQTPLAVIINKLENLIQTEGLNEQHFAAIQAVYESAIRLSKLNNSLLLLTKIDNSQYIQKELVDLKSVIEKYLGVYEDIIKEKGIKLIATLNETVKISMNPFLAETLISNLLSNSIKHNIQNGEIKITLTLKELNITNTGSFNTLDTSALFKRFKKGNPSSESLGLGLSIIKKIAGSNNMVIDYKIEENRHIISLQF
ncbi:MAG TPA: HAMP domain-containing sensor histidine kinase [Bacteroidia bacterium]|jgi:signal transduction histidine kinase|nr:HAMP domain-containing sensor histidine kinase [Bacteroidia bacterium]